MNRLLRIVLLIAVLGVAGYGESQAQCRLFTKKNCIPMLDPYISNGQFNGAILYEGESASLIQTFYSGQEYRLLVCAHELLEGAYFEVKDSNGNKLFTNKDKVNSHYWDFQVASTQQLSIDVIIPDQGGNNEMKKSGCVSIMIGFK